MKGECIFDIILGMNYGLDAGFAEAPEAQVNTGSSLVKGKSGENPAQSISTVWGTKKQYATGYLVNCKAI